MILGNNGFVSRSTTQENMLQTIFTVTHERKQSPLHVCTTHTQVFLTHFALVRKKYRDCVSNFETIIETLLNNNIFKFKNKRTMSTNVMENNRLLSCLQVLTGHVKSSPLHVVCAVESKLPYLCKLAK